MSFLRGSANYVWCTTSVLGKGATAAVFQGVNKNNGEPVAVKTFNPLSLKRPADVQVREFDVLKKVNHGNIVKLLAIEEEQESRGKVIVMELCTGGSLYNILDDPENTYGLREEEFMLVLEHLAAGMKHLRDNNLVHRDLKPGNIMKFISDDGTTVYKLTDFGAARELGEDQHFVSLYGTEEYLHPDMYEHAVLRHPAVKKFGATVDLWSIGVTLYHVATGNLPFQPFGGRRNKETMYRITTKKDAGVIAGSQSSEGGPIEWSKELPNYCQLSFGIKKHVTPILAGLLEIDGTRIWSFDKFFSEVTSCLSRKLVHVFHMHKAQSIRIYLHPDDTYEELQSLIMEQTDISHSSQILLFQDSSLLSIIEEHTRGCGYPDTKQDEPIMLFSTEDNNITLVPPIDLDKFPTFPNLVSVENDATLAKTVCSVGHACKRRIEQLSFCSTLMHKCVDQFTTAVSKDLEGVLMKSERLQDVTKCIEDMVDLVLLSERSIRALLRVTGESVPLQNDWKAELAKLTKDQSDLSLSVKQLHQRYVAERSMRREWSAATRDQTCPADARAPARARSLIDRLRDSWQHLLRDRATRTLTYNDEQFHVLERIKIGETARRMRTLLDTECQPAVAQLAESLADWYKMAQTVFVQTRILDKDVDTYERKLDALTCRLGEANKSFHESVLATVDKVKATVDKVEAPVETAKSHDNMTIRKKFKEIQVVWDQIALITKENSNLVGELVDINDEAIANKPRK